MRDSVSSSTEFKKRDFSQSVWNALIRVYKGWVSFHMKVNQERAIGNSRVMEAMVDERRGGLLDE